MTLAKRAKIMLLQGARRAGLLAILRDTKWRERRLLILCYHGISLADEHEWAPAYYMSPALFESRMKKLEAGGYSVLPLGNALEMLSSGTLPPRSVALTFDDGSADFYLRAFPILERFGFHATVYLTTYYCGHPKPVFGVFCSYVLWKARSKGVLSKSLIGESGEWGIGTSEGRLRAVSDIRRFAEQSQMSTPEKDEFAMRLAEALRLDYSALIERRILQIMSPAEVEKLSRSGVEFELHTHRHRTPLDQNLFERELDDNQARIVAMTGRRPSHFCYPSGQYELVFLDWLRRQGVRSATTCEGGLVSEGTEPLLLPRIIDGGHLTEVEFESWLSGFGQLLPRRTAHSPSH